MFHVVLHPAYDMDRHATHMTVVLWGSTPAIAWNKWDLRDHSGEVPTYATYKGEYDFMLGWARDIKQGLKQFSAMPIMVRKCLDSAKRYVEAQTHHMDRRVALELACQFLPILLTVLERCTTQRDHESCRGIVYILSTMSARMNGGINWDEFCAVPRTDRLDEIALLSGLDFTEANEFQFQLGYATRTQANAVMHKYLAQMKNDGLDKEETMDVQNLVKWVEAGMFMSLVPLTPDPCVCESCRLRRAL